MSSPFGGAVKGLETDSDLRCASRGVLSRVDVHDRCAGLVQSRVRGGVLALPHAARLRALVAPYAEPCGRASPTTCDGPRPSPGDYPSLLVFASRASLSRPCPGRAVVLPIGNAIVRNRDRRRAARAPVAGRGDPKSVGRNFYVIRLM